MSRFLRPALLAIILISTILVVLLIVVGHDTAFIEKYYTPLIWITTSVAVLFSCLIFVYLARLFLRAKEGQYGVKILGKFSAALILSAIIPGILIFFTSVQFLYKSVDSWFDVRVERALDAGLTLGREVLDTAQQDLLKKAVRIAGELSTTPKPNLVNKLDQLRERESCDEAVLLSSTGSIIGVSGQSYQRIVPTAPTVRELQDALGSGYKIILDDSDSSRLVVRVIIPVTHNNLRLDSFSPLGGFRSGDALSLLSPATRELVQNRNQLFLELSDTLPSSLAGNAEMLMNGYRDYQEMVLTRDGLRTIYLTTLTLVLLLSLFGATALSTYLATRISKPLMYLLEGTRKVGEGHYELVTESQSNDEVGELTRSFNIMIAQLDSTRKDLENRGKELEEAKRYLERILSKMSSGVIVVDSGWKMVSLNPSASKITNMDLVSHLGESLEEVLPNFYDAIMKVYGEEHHENVDISFQTELVLGRNRPKRVVVYARGTELLLGNQKGYLLVFDDVTRLAAAQRTEAWGEVARRLAHEIKNPLTPIRLAAERLQLRLSDKVTGKEYDILQKATTTIVDQVSAMKQMVDDFRLYAKLGAPRYEPLDLGKFVQEVTALYEAANFKVVLDIEPDTPKIEGDPNQLRQALHNLFSNANEAARPDIPMEVRIIVKSVHVDDSDQLGVELRFEDNGTGFPEKILEHAFEPYVTTKPSGTGLGLPMIKKITEEHGGTIGVENILGEDGRISGAAVVIIFRMLSRNSGKNETIR